MSLVSRIHSIVEDTFAWVSLMLKQNILSYCSLEAADDKHVLVTKQGEILSIIQLEGYKRFIGPDEFNFLNLGVEVYGDDFYIVGYDPEKFAP